MNVHELLIVAAVAWLAIFGLLFATYRYEDPYPNAICHELDGQISCIDREPAVATPNLAGVQ